VALAMLLLVPAAAGAATDISLSAGADPTTVKRGDQVVLSVDVRNGGAVRAFRGRVRRKGQVRPLRPGRYRKRATTTDDLSVPSPPVYASFRVVR
jgi:hypothetical protein